MISVSDEYFIVLIETVGFPFSEYVRIWDVQEPK